MSATTEQQRQMCADLIRMLEIDMARLKNLPDSEFTDAYLGFRSRLEETLKKYFGNVIGSIVGFVARWSSDIWSVLMNEGVDPYPRDPNTFTLDPAPFKDMIEIIVAKSKKPDHSQMFTDIQEISDYSKLKRFTMSIVDTVAEWGPSSAAVQQKFFKTISTILDGISVTEVRRVRGGNQALSLAPEIIPFHFPQRVSSENRSYTVEVKKAGTVILGHFHTTFSGELSSSCCSDKQEITMVVVVKVWKFATIRQMKEEFNSITA